MPLALGHLSPRSEGMMSKKETRTATRVTKVTTEKVRKKRKSKKKTKGKITNPFARPSPDLGLRSRGDSTSRIDAQKELIISEVDDYFNIDSWPLPTIADNAPIAGNNDMIHRGISYIHRKREESGYYIPLPNKYTNTLQHDGKLYPELHPNQPIEFLDIINKINPMIKKWRGKGSGIVIKRSTRTRD